MPAGRIVRQGRAHLRHDQLRRHARHPGIRAGERGQGHTGGAHPATGAGTGAGRHHRQRHFGRVDRYARAAPHPGTREADGDRAAAQPKQAADHAGRRGALHCRALPSGDVLDDRQHDSRGWRREHCRMNSMKDNGLPCLDLLEATPTILRGLMAELSAEDGRWKPAPGRFSVGEVLAHLSHTEGHCYRARLDRFLSEENPEFEGDDAQHHLELYRDMDPEDAFDHFEEQRETNIEALRDSPPGAGDRHAVHKEVGPITLAQMLNEWELHDLGHIRPIAELVRARKYLAVARPLAASYELKP